MEKSEESSLEALVVLFPNSTRTTIRRMKEQIDNIVDALLSATRDAQQLCTELSAEALVRRVMPGTWSIAECLMHLALTSRKSIPIAEAGLAAAPREDGKLRRDLIGIALEVALEPPYRLRSKTSAAFDPQGENVSDALQHFRSTQETLIQIVESSRGLAIDRVKVRSPFDARVRYNLYSFFRILAAHERRHLWQASRIRAALESAGC